MLLALSILGASQLLPSDELTVGRNSRTGKRYKLLNGRSWNRTSDSGKINFVLGYVEAIEALGDNDAMTTVPNVQIKEIVKALDGFYTEPENLPFRIVDAIYIFAAKSAGLRQSEIEELMRAMRSASSPNPVQDR